MIRRRTDTLTQRLLVAWPCPSDAVQADKTSTMVQTTVSIHDDDALLPWSTGVGEVQLAARMWLSLTPAARRLLEILIEVAPQRVAAPDLASRIGLETGPAGLAGHLSRPTRVAAQLGRELPVSWVEGEPSAYWIEEEIALTFEAAIPLAASEEFDATQTGDDHPAFERRPASTAGGSRRSVPRHVLEVFASHPEERELTVRQIAAAASTEYAADEISQGAIAAALNRRGVDGIEVVPGSSPVRARRRKV